MEGQGHRHFCDAGRHGWLKTTGDLGDLIPESVLLFTSMPKRPERYDFYKRDLGVLFLTSSK